MVQKHGIRRCQRSPPFILAPFNNSGFQSPLLSPSILHVIPWKSPNGEMDKGHEKTKQNASIREDFQQ